MCHHCVVIESEIFFRPTSVLSTKKPRRQRHTPLRKNVDSRPAKISPIRFGKCGITVWSWSVKYFFAQHNHTVISCFPSVSKNVDSCPTKWIPYGFQVQLVNVVLLCGLAIWNICLRWKVIFYIVLNESLLSLKH